MVKSRWEGGGWPMCQPQFKELGSWIGMDLGTQGPTLEPFGTGDWDWDLGLTIMTFPLVERIENLDFYKPENAFLA